MQNCDGRTRVYRQRGQWFSKNCVQKRNRGGGGGVHVWAGITQFNKTDLVILNGNVNCRCYIDNVLLPVALPFLRENYRRGNFIYQNDSALAHSARLTVNFLATNRTRTVFSEENVFPPPTSLNRHIVKKDRIYNKLKVTIHLYVSLVRIHPFLNEIGC